MAMFNRNLIGNNDAAAGVGARLLRQARDEDVSPLLLVEGFLTCVMAVRAAAAASRAAESVLLPYPVYLGALAGAFVGGLATMWAAGWVAGNAARRRAAGRAILGASLVPMVVAIGLGNDYNLFFDILRALA
ncbi:unnamed protein product [Urochloa decumbens]|uniref:Uncharacterized protein n=1 Tax=Urochloa decumbens TaxID=240449 RepID=A0ABC8ZGZ4_9POAL